MTLYEFNLLPYNKKASLIQEHGVYIGKIKQGNQTLILFQVESFYVEILYSKYRCSITNFRCFLSTEELQPYLNQVNVEDLIKCVS